VDGADRLRQDAKVVVSAPRQRSNAAGPQTDATTPVAQPGQSTPGSATPAPMTAGQMERADSKKHRKGSTDPNAAPNAAPNAGQPKGNQP
jgi:hypothetical protein